MEKNKYLTTLQAYVTLEDGKTSLGEEELNRLYASGDLAFCGDVEVNDGKKVGMVENDDEVTSIDDLDLDDDTSRAFRNVLQSIKNISSFVSYAHCDDNIKQDIADMGERFLAAMERKIIESFTYR